MNNPDYDPGRQRALMSEAEALKLFEDCSNRGRWGDHDELGTLNYITPQKRLAAVGLVTLGRVVSLGKDLDLVRSVSNPDPVIHRMLYVAHAEPGASLDVTEIAPHGFSVTHMDAVGHVYLDGWVYNGHRASDVATMQGLTFGAITAARDGVITRGVLLDVAGVRGVPWLESDEGVWPEDLEAAEALAGTRVESGDAIFVRTGLGRLEATAGPQDPARRAGIVAECMPWLHERGVAVYSGDCIDRLPQPYPRLTSPLHQIGLAAMGLSILDSPAIEVLNDTCHELGRFDFLVTYAPLKIPGGTGSAVNPLCLF